MTFVPIGDESLLEFMNEIKHFSNDFITSRASMPLAFSPHQFNMTHTIPCTAGCIYNLYAGIDV